MVEIEGERVLAASCKRTPAVGMKVKTATERATKARAMVLELLVADQPERETSHDPTSHFWVQADFLDVSESRFPAAERWTGDFSHPAMSVNLDACIQCNLCVRACREVQVNDVIGMAYRSADAKIVFDFDDPMGGSTCVACGECVQACPTGALMPSAYLDAEHNTRTVYPDREVTSLCPYCGVGCQVSYKVKDEKIVYAEGVDGPANHNRLCVKGRFGFDYVHHPHRPTRSTRPTRGRTSARRPGRRRSTAPPAASRRSATPTETRRSPGSAPRRARTRKPTSSRSWCGSGSVRTTSTTAPGCATPRRSPPSWRG
jgi:formate dehydrogenase major subunit